MESLLTWLKAAKLSRKRFLSAGALLFLSAKLKAYNVPAPTLYFKHGVASGDPRQDRVIIWTRISQFQEGKPVLWEMAEDSRFRKIIARGTANTSASKDYTVKVDVSGLRPGKVYHYRFKYQDIYSNTGRTKTLPASLDGKTFQLAVVSCNNYEAGYFNSFRFLADKEEVEAVLHLGDYIYEYETGRYGDTSIGRIHDPLHEIIALDDYRRRYSLYRSDPDLQKLHASKPFFMVWDDHEFANNAYLDGAQNHQLNEGEWKARKEAAMQAYFEWLPLRADKVSGISNKVSIGNEIELYLLDQRMSGKTKQATESDAAFYSPERAMLGADQYQWLESSLKTSKAKWKFIGSQVMFTGYASPAGETQPSYADWWVGYPHERNKVINLIEKENIDNVVFLTGDHHKSFVLATHREEGLLKFSKPCTEKPLAWELLSPSITSRNMGHLPAKEIEEAEEKLYRKEVNPHLLYADVKSHGYFIATLSENQFRADYYYTDNLRSRVSTESLAASFTMDQKSFILERTA